MAGILTAKTYAKLFQELLRYAVSVTKAERAAVLFDEEADGHPEVQTVLGFDEDIWSGDEAHLPVIERVIKLGRADLIVDARELESLGEADGSKGRSALCVPLRAGKNIVRGVLYLDSSKPNAFQNSQRDHLDMTTKEFALRYATLYREGEDAPDKSRSSMYAMVGLAMFVLLVLVVVAVAMLSPPK